MGTFATINVEIDLAAHYVHFIHFVKSRKLTEGRWSGHHEGIDVKVLINFFEMPKA